MLESPLCASGIFIYCARQRASPSSNLDPSAGSDGFMAKWQSDAAAITKSLSTAETESFPLLLRWCRSLRLPGPFTDASTALEALRRQCGKPLPIIPLLAVYIQKMAKRVPFERSPETPKKTHSFRQTMRILLESWLGKRIWIRTILLTFGITLELDRKMWMHRYCWVAVLSRNLNYDTI